MKRIIRWLADVSGVTYEIRKEQIRETGGRLNQDHYWWNGGLLYPMKTGIELIAEERREQIEKHGRTVEADLEFNSGIEKPLTKAASALSVEQHGLRLMAHTMKPRDWDQSIWDKMMSKSYKERLIIAGALIAAEIDRLQAENIQKSEPLKP